MSERKKLNNMSKLINIDGNYINIDSIKSVTKIKEDHDFSPTFWPCGWFEFYLEYDDKYIRYSSERFRVNFFNNKPKSQIEKDFRLTKLIKKRNEILNILGINEE